MYVRMLLYMYIVATVHTSYNLNVTRVCRPRNAHALLLHVCTLVRFYLLHHEYMRKHTRYVCINTRFFIHAHVSHGVTCTQLHLYSLAN